MPDSFDYAGFDAWELETLAEEFCRKKSLTPDDVKSLKSAKFLIELALDTVPHEHV